MASKLVCQYTTPSGIRVKGVVRKTERTRKGQVIAFFQGYRQGVPIRRRGKLEVIGVRDESN